MNSETIKPYTTTPRYIPDDLRSGKITFSEWVVYQWLRDNADPYGKSTTSLMSIKEDTLKDTSKNNINVILLSLKSKKYIYYEPRQGRRGSFDVYFGDWLSPDGKIRQIDKYFDGDHIRSTEINNKEPATEVNQNQGDTIQKLESQKSQLLNKVSFGSNKEKIRSSYNDTDNKKENELTYAKPLKKIPVGSFVPKNWEQQRCQEIAREVREEYMNPLLSILNNKGWQIIERAYGIFCEDKQSGKSIESPRKYLYGIIKNILQNQ